MNKPDIDLDALLARAAGDPRPQALVQDAGRGLEARVLQRLPARGTTWTEAWSGIVSWKALACMACITLGITVWSSMAGAFDMMDEEWITAQLDTPAPGPDDEELSLEF